MLRAKNEGTGLRFVSERADILDESSPLPEYDRGWVGKFGPQLVVKLKSRKNKMFGCVIVRSCVCKGSAGVSGHVPSVLCPVHVLWEWLLRNVRVGQLAFNERTAPSALRWLRIALLARGVKDAGKYGLHSLRRGSARALVENGGDLATLLQAGGWKSAAFTSYLDMMGVEATVFEQGCDTLLAVDSDED